MPRKKRDLKQVTINLTSINDLFLEQLKKDYEKDKTKLINIILDKARLIYFKDRLIL